MPEWSFLAVALVVICTPGPDTVLTIRSSLAGGPAAGRGIAAGVALGQLIWTVAASGGAAAVLAESDVAFRVLAWLGAGYLVALALGQLRDPVGGNPLIDQPPCTARARSVRRGLVSNLANPKMLVFSPLSCRSSGLASGTCSLWVLCSAPLPLRGWG